MTKRHLIFVPKNEEGIREYETGSEDSENFEVFDIPEEEFEKLWKHRVFDILNDRFDLLIDECEEETVTADQLKEAYDAISLIDGEWMKAVNRTIETGLCAYLHF